ncbi:MAG: hypothetical protein ACLPXB_17515 [Thiobacillaceae bacterium]
MNNAHESEFDPRVAEEYLFAALFDLLDELVTRNRAYDKVLTDLVGKDQLSGRIKQLESLRFSVAEPRIYTDLRNRAIAAAVDRNPAELVSLARELSERTHLWMKTNLPKEGGAK